MTPLQGITRFHYLLHSVSYKYLKSFLGIGKIPNNNLTIGPVTFWNIIKSFLTNTYILVDKNAAANSNFGIDVYIIVPTRDFAITKLQWTLPAVSTNLRYVACP